MSIYETTSPLRQALARLRGKVRGLVLIIGASRLLIYAVLALLGHFFADYLLRLPLGARMVGISLFSAGFVYIAVRQLVRPLSFDLTDARLAARVERAFPQLKDRLASSLAFATAGKDPENPDSPALMQAVAEETVEVTRSLPLAGILRPAFALRIGVVALALLLGTAIAAASHSVLVSTFFQRNFLARNLSWPRRTTLEVVGMRPLEPRQVTRGRDTTIQVRAQGSLPDQILFSYWETESPRSRVEVLDLSPSPEESSLFSLTIPLYASTSFTVEGGDDDRREVYRIEALTPPGILRIRVQCDYPDYLELSDEQLSGGDQKLPQGTKARLLVESNMDLKGMTMALGAESPAEMERLEPRLFARDLVVENDLRYALRMMGMNGQENDPASDTFVLRMMRDQAPVIRVQTPGLRSDRLATGVVLVGFTVRDDHKIVSARLIYDVARGKERSVPLGESGGDAVRLLAAPAQPRESLCGIAVIDLALLRTDDGKPITHNETVRFRIEATDSSGKSETSPPAAATPMETEITGEDEIGRDVQSLQQNLREAVERAHEKITEARASTTVLRELFDGRGAAAPADEVRVATSRAQGSQARVTDELTGIAAQAARVFHIHVFNRLEDRSSADQILPFFERHLLEPQESSSAPFRGSLYRDLWRACQEKAIRAGGSLGKLLEMADLADRLAADSCPGAYRALGMIPQAKDAAASLSSLEEARATQELLAAGIDRLSRLMRDWQSYENVLRFFRNLKESQKRILEEARGAGRTEK